MQVQGRTYRRKTAVLRRLGSQDLRNHAGATEVYQLLAWVQKEVWGWMPRRLGGPKGCRSSQWESPEHHPARGRGA